jgi:hypothetical protein
MLRWNWLGTNAPATASEIADLKPGFHRKLCQLLAIQGYADPQAPLFPHISSDP